MPWVAESACVSCNLRKVKCDKSLPACLICRRAGWKCPGYRNAWRFRRWHPRPNVAVKAVADHQAQPYGSVIRFNQSSTSCSTDSNELLHGVLNQTCLFTLDPQHLMSEADHLQGLLINHLTNFPSSICASFLPSHPYLHHLPARVGLNKALDDAVRCICSIPDVASLETQMSANHEQQIAYHTALQSLQQTLNIFAQSPVAECSVETLAAVMLLQMFEQTTDFESQNWIHHAGGAARFIEALGPSFFNEGLSAAILLSQMGRINFESLRQKHDSYLGSPSWQVVFDSFATCDTTALGSGSAKNELLYHRNVSLFPALFRRYRIWFTAFSKSASNSSPSVKPRSGEQESRGQLDDFTSEVQSISEALNKFKEGFKNWRISCLGSSSVADVGINARTQPQDDNPTFVNSIEPIHQDRLTNAMDTASAAFLLYATVMLLELDTRQTLQNLEFECLIMVGAVERAWNSLRNQSSIAARLLAISLTDIWISLSDHRSSLSGELRCCNDVFQRLDRATGRSRRSLQE